MKLHRLTIVLMVLSFIFFSVGNTVLSVTDPVESNYALTAKEMVLSGDWLSPQIYGHYWYDKPIMIYWLIAASYKVLGFTDFAARLPSTLFATFTVGLLYQLVRSFAGRRLLALLSATILATSLLFWTVAHGIITDMVLMFATVGTMGYAYKGLMKDRTSYMVVAYGFAGLGVLTKGPVALVLPGILLLLFVWSMKSRTMLKRLFAWQGICCFLLVAMPWYGYMYHVHGQAFIDGFLGLNNVVRATQSEHPKDNVWWYYLAVFLFASLPWTGSVIYGMVTGWKKRLPFYKFTMIMGWGTILFYSLMATKYPLYTCISLIPFSVLGASGLIQALRPGSSRRVWWTLLGPTFLLWILYVIASFFVSWGFWYLLYVVVATCIVVSICYWISQNRYMVPAVVALGTVLISSIVVTEGLEPLLYQRSARELIPVVQHYKGPVYFYNTYATSLVYYTGVHAIRVNAAHQKKNEEVREARSNAWEGKYRMEQIDDAMLKDVITRNEPLLIVVPRKEEEFFSTDFLQEGMVPCYQSNEYVVYAIHQ